jgi:very-short-patch-repair endonuclease
VEQWVRAGWLHRVFRGVYAVGHPAISREARWLAAVLAGGEGAVLSHLSAAALWGLIAVDGGEADVIAGRGRKGQRGMRVHRAREAPEATEHHGIAVTTPARTLLDLAATFTPANLERAFGEAQILQLLDEDALHEALARHPGRRGAARIRALVDEPCLGIPRNVMERRFLKLCREARLPRPEVNHPWGRWEIDFLFREHGVAVETDGRAAHTRRAQFQRDREKDRDLQLAGLIALRFTYAEVMRRPDVVTAGCCRACASGRARAWSAGSPTR